METEQIVQLIVFIICILLSSFFSSAETALMSVNKIRIRNMVDEKVRGAQTVHLLLEDSSKLLGSILVGNNLVNIGASALATSLSIHFFGNTGVGIATGVVTLLVLIFGEITPKSLAAENAESLSLKIAPIVYFLVKVLSPVTTVLLLITNGIIKMLGGKIDEDKPFVTQEELLTLVNVGHEEGVLEYSEREMLENVFEFKSSQVRSVMTPRTDVVAIDIDIEYEDLLNMFRDEQYSRLPVYEGSIDKIIGLLHVRDFINIKLADEFFNIRDHIREVFWTFEAQNTMTLLQELRSEKLYMAVVLDEYGGTSGIITIEDIVEEIIGEIEDEYDMEAIEVRQLSEDSFLAEGSAKIDFVNEIADLEIPEDDFDTLGGFYLDEAGKIPDEGDSIEFEGARFVVMEMDKNRIEKIKIERNIEMTEDAGGGNGN